MLLFRFDALISETIFGVISGFPYAIISSIFSENFSVFYNSFFTNSFWKLFFFSIVWLNWSIVLHYELDFYNLFIRSDGPSIDFYSFYNSVSFLNKGLIKFLSIYIDLKRLTFIRRWSKKKPVCITRYDSLIKKNNVKNIRFWIYTKTDILKYQSLDTLRISKNG